MSDKIEEKLSKLMEIATEEDYNAFLASNSLIEIYDKIMMVDENADDILTEEALSKILNIIEKQLELYKQ